MSVMQAQSSSALHPLWRKVVALDGRVFFFNPFTGRISKDAFPAPPPVLGGILSDEVPHILHLQHSTFHSCLQAQALVCASSLLELPFNGVDVVLKVTALGQIV